jgi:hypothetical protein
MPLLDNGNTQFATAVTRAWRPHYKSASLDTLEAALLAVQNNPANGGMLQTLYVRLREWIVAHPREFGKRGSLVGQLVYQIERRAQALGISVVYEAGWFRMLTVRHNVQMWTPLRDLRAALAGHNADWLIRVTDIPVGPGLYNHTPEDRYALEDRATALAELGPTLHPQNDPRFWLRLGRHVMTARADTHRYGRCYSCASAVIHTLVADAAFNDYMIEHVASTNYDHHLVLVGRSNANGVSNAGLADGWDQWKWSAVIVDAWQANIPPATTNFASLAHQNQYAQSPLTWYCAYTPANRAADRAFAAALGPVVRVAPQPAMVAAARLAQQADGPPRYRKEGGRWVLDV